MATRWGIAGAGKISHDFVSAMKSLPASEHTLIAVAARDLSRAQKFADLHKIQHAYDEYEQLAKNSEIEVVYIGVLNPQHFEVAHLMLSHGKHVLCEKPLTMNTKETVNLINFAKEKNLFLMEAVWSRCFPIYEVVKEQIDSDKIGKIHQVVASFGFNMPHIERLNSKQMGGGTVLDLGIYVLQFASLIFNEEIPQKVHAAGFLNEDGVDISTSVTLLYSGNRTATLLTHSLVDLPNEACVLGTKGMLRIPNFWSPSEVYVCGNKIECPLPKTTGTFNFINSVGLSYEAAEVRNCLQKGLLESPKVPHDLSIRLANLEDEIRRQIGVQYPQD